ncbi:CshA/CshB family fibrillar adhesin-related protein [Alloscardovia macacae]|uniref:CshA/CshB family fibrillar adhesin-related protein n=1 Tax=Alloscardovia macacae TaxID=1160091 RepID=UPI0027D9D1AE|nr:CshA/CshB family fibrillar adhesin-related protein [Alloscardovia macacae]
MSAAPLTADQQKNHFTQYQDSSTKRNKNLDDLKNQLYFIDWSDTSAVTGLGEVVTHGSYAGPELLVGSTWKKEIAPDYVVTVKVVKLKNIEGEDNGVLLNPGSEKYTKVKDAGGNPDVRYNGKVVAYGGNYNGWSAAEAYGLHLQGQSSISGEINNAGCGQCTGELQNVGISFDISATYRGKPVKPAFFALSAEEAKGDESEIYKTNGKGWELLTELSSESTTQSFEANDKGWHENLATQIYTGSGYEASAVQGKITALSQAMANTKITAETVSVSHPNDYKLAADGLGTQVFGPVSNRKDRFSTPIIVTRGATHIDAYLISAGAQAFAFGIIALDEADAPASYGTAAHAITPGLDNKTVQPFIGSQEADIDEKDLTTTLPDWTRDDQTGEPADEGAVQLMGDSVKKNENYTLHHANDKTYELEILADPRGNSSSYVRAWVDFNNDGKFADDETSDIEEVKTAGKLTVKFPNVPQNVDPSVEKLGMRVRTAIKRADIEKPTGFAFSGEAEDFQIQQTVPPRGSTLATKESQGVTQSGQITFTSYAQTDYETANTAIDTSVKPVMLTKGGTEVKDSDLDADGYYVVKGQGKYKITSPASAKDVSVKFVPDPDFVGKADGISVRRVDTNGKSTGWGRNGNAIVGGEFLATSAALDTMDGSFIPEVTPVGVHGTDAESKGMQGAPQEGTVTFAPDADEPHVKALFTPSGTYPAKLVDPETKELKDQLDAKDATGKSVGTYTIEPTTGKVTFQPVPTFTGKPLPATVQLEAPVGQDKDGKPSLATATATYQPDVKGTTFTIDPAASEDRQGAVQTGTPKFAPENELGDVGKLTYSLVDPVTDTLTTDPVIVDGEGTYTINPDTGDVTFTPVASYVGTRSIFVRATTSTGVVSEKAEYKVTVKPLEVTSEPVESEGKKGEKQTRTPKFTPPQAPKGTSISTTPDYVFEDGTTKKVVDKQGTFTLDPKSGEVTFQPVPEFVGSADLVTVKATYTLTAVDKTTVPLMATATYTPKVLLPRLKGSEVSSKDIQGRKQERTVTFTLDDGSVIAPSAQYPAKLVDPRTRGVTDELTTDALDGERKVGTYTIEPSTGHVTFQPDVTYAGTPQPARVSLTAKAGEDKDGQPVLADEARGTYAPDVIPVALAHTDKETSGVQGTVQTGRPEFSAEDGDGKTVDFTRYALLDPSTGTEVPASAPVTLDGVGTYRIDPATGEVTFTPVAAYVTATDGSNATHVTVRAFTATGMSEDAVYTPRVTSLVASGSSASSEGPQGASQSGEPEFSAPSVPDGLALSRPIFAFADGSVRMSVSGEGIYELDPATGKVTFTPAARFMGAAKGMTVVATFMLTGADGSTAPVVASAEYVPSVYIITDFVDESGKPLADRKKGDVPAQDIPGYVLKETTTDEFGNVTHHYAKVVAVIPPKKAPAKKLSKTGTAVLSILVVSALATAGGAASLLLRKRSEK